MLNSRIYNYSNCKRRPDMTFNMWFTQWNLVAHQTPENAGASFEKKLPPHSHLFIRAESYHGKI